jgi:hypothetical protein
VKAAWVTAVTVSAAPPPRLTVESMLVAVLASVVAALMLVYTAEDIEAGAVIATLITTLPAVIVTATSDDVTPLPAVAATAVLMSSMTVVA